MKRILLLWVAACLAACLGLVDCGSSDIPTTVALPPDSSGGAGGGTTVGGFTSTGTTMTGTTTGDTTTSGSTGAGGDVTSGVGTGPTTSTTGGTSGTGGTTGAGGSGGNNTGAGGTGGSGLGGAGGVGPVDAGTCPPMPPMNGSICANMGAVCGYPGMDCTCAPMGMARDGGARDAWRCVPARPDAGACPPLAPANGTMCMTAGQVCSYARETCTCQMPMGRGMRDRWVCGVNASDAGGGG
jgi:hypothetical protein